MITKTRGFQEMPQQMDPTIHGTNYQYNFEDGSRPLGSFSVFVAGRTATSASPVHIYDAMTEHWAAGGFSTLPLTAPTLNVVATPMDDHPPPGFSPSGMKVMPARVSWGSTAVDLPAESPGFYFSSDPLPFVVMDFTKLQTENKIVWYVHGDAGAYITGTSGRRFSSSSRDFPPHDYAVVTIEGLTPEAQPSHCWLFSQTATGSQGPVDSVGGMNGTLSASGASYPPNSDLINGAVDLTSAGYVELPADAVPAVSFSLAWWYCRSSTSVGVVLGNWPLGGDAGVAVLSNGDGKLLALIQQGTSPTQTLTSGALADDTWYHVTLTVALDAGSPKVATLYVDELAVDGASLAASTLRNSTRFRLGSPANAVSGLTSAAPAQYGDLRVYDSVLSLSDIQRVSRRFID